MNSNLINFSSLKELVLAHSSKGEGNINEYTE